MSNRFGGRIYTLQQFFFCCWVPSAVLKRILQGLDFQTTKRQDTPSTLISPQAQYGLFGADLEDLCSSSEIERDCFVILLSVFTDISENGWCVISISNTLNKRLKMLT
jgi:hypothetical protein